MATVWMLLLLWGPVWLFDAVVLVIAVLAVGEYIRMTDVFVEARTGLVAGGAMLLPLAGALVAPEGMMAGAVAGQLVLLALLFKDYSRFSQPLPTLALSGLGLLWIGLGAAHLALAWNLEHGNGWLLVLSALTAGSDTGAYYAGRCFGRSKLCPRISPGKTVAGAVGGMGAGLLAALAGKLIFLPAAGWGRLLLLAPLLVIIGIMGDLAESIVKRATGTKDSGTLLAGHGGVLDRLDSLLLTAPTLYYFVRFGLLQ